MSSFVVNRYGPVFAPLLQTDRCRPLDAGRPEPSVAAKLQAATVEAGFAGRPVVDDDYARCCVAGLWLLHDFLDESHTISQGIATPSGSFWHGIMHRREGDFSNAKYWFRRVGDHATYEELGAASLGLAIPSQLADRVAPRGHWDPLAMVDACHGAAQGEPGADGCRRLQQAEWEILWDHCFRQTVGEPQA